MENLLPFFGLGVALILGFSGIFFTFKKKSEKNEISRMELQKEILQLEIQKQKDGINLTEK